MSTLRGTGTGRALGQASKKAPGCVLSIGPGGLAKREAITAYLALLPSLASIGLLVWYPFINSIYHSFTRWDGYNSSWIGLHNYIDIISNGDLWMLLRTNAVFLLSVPGILLISLVLSVLLYEQVPGWWLFRSVYYLPTILSAAVVGMLMKTMFSPVGAVNQLLKDLGLAFLTTEWLSSTPTAFMVLILAFYWQTLGQGVLIFLSGLANVSTELFEAARIDGASWWQRFWKVTLPLLVPTIAYFMIINVIWIFVGLFALVYTVTGGGPGYSTTPIDYMIYLKAFQVGDMGYASALAVILFVIVAIVSGVQLKIFDKLTTE
ncbi:binding-protein-dependent transport systems inner membrane component [Thermobaculum terrenum ATCC BAA-798]|uniref:Binding-protein-dependent transport systems inner membrane component n=1 Tax=Thermobaculum terrenum (strain ATCC BAA-798 / CCMEE 7001 / YNP1) TaxID=525904 RepID=D1CGJ7_THET1|nr:sugar ABC transporter permease [Thermobaculum terrenum]ACZ42868.1 binding-protein-dependent transport systems inner membrane component [Thermobaculum terrenum ATCC BAA-798]